VTSGLLIVTRKKKRKAVMAAFRLGTEMPLLARWS
jgi:hypothetical protein